MMNSVKNCSICNSELAWMVGDSVFVSSDDINNFDICRSCLIEHCISTNCLGCEIRKYPECEFIDMKVYHKEIDLK